MALLSIFHRKRPPPPTGPRIGPFWPSDPLYWEAVAHKYQLDLITEQGRLAGCHLIDGLEQMSAIMSGFARGISSDARSR